MSVRNIFRICEKIEDLSKKESFFGFFFVCMSIIFLKDAFLKQQEKLFYVNQMPFLPCQMFHLKEPKQKQQLLLLAE